MNRFHIGVGIAGISLLLPEGSVAGRGVCGPAGQFWVVLQGRFWVYGQKKGASHRRKVEEGKKEGREERKRKRQ
jgi:hypothetical protein